jgi:alanyl-tRNA synthetase
MMTSREIRQSFLDFFRSKGHDIVPSSPVVLQADPTLLFANAGMNQFKEIFLGAREATAKRIADTQKCIRVSGKHNDLEEVGHDTYHHTFFEMLGNWSFGDYTKREAIAWAWELLTVVWKLPKERLWVTVFREDDEAERIWREVADIDPAHILRFNEKDNFWEMGETGPCGPCSEIHFDRTPNGCDAKLVNAGSPDCIEIWNLVFMQHNRRSDGSLEDLPARHVDTGMGFERVVAVIQGKASNYDTDVFMPLIEAVAARCGKPYEGEDAIAMRVIADHIRTLSFAIADGVLPSNEGRGYVLRRLLRRAVRYGRKLGLRDPFLGDLVPVLESAMGDVFPELPRNRTQVLRALKAEEEGFAATLDRGIALFEDVAAAAARDGGKTFPGDQAFKLYDTFGFPIDLTRLMAAEKGLATDEAGFEALMAAQRERGRAARKGGAAAREGDVVADLVSAGIRSTFTGYDALDGEATVLALFQDGARVVELPEGATGDVLLDATPFYGEAGGQVGDTGRIEADGASFEVIDTQKPADGILMHRGRVASGRIAEGMKVRARVDAARRAAILRHHTATHLLNAALREFVSPQVKQAGSMVSPDRLRFDFTWFEGIDPATLARVEARVNGWILENRPVRTSSMALKDVAGSGIIAVFDEKYGETVRVIDVDGVSKELCGGTHAAQTGQIGLFRIASEGSVAAGVRRIEAMCGMPAYEWTRAEHDLVADLCRRFSANPSELSARIDALVEGNRKLEKELKQKAAASALGQVDALLAKARDVAGVPLVAGFAGEVPGDALRDLADAIRAKLPSGVIVLGSSSEGKAAFIATVSDDLVKRGVHAGKLIGAVAKLAGGGGGGQPARAQAGGKDPSKASDAVAKAAEFLAAQFGG